MFRNATTLFLLFFVLFVQRSNSQSSQFQHSTVTGMYGLIEIPTARFSSDRIGQIAYAYYPEGSKLIYGHQAGKMLNVSMMVTSYFNFSLHLVNPVDRENLPHGIGDRSIKMKFKLLSEKKYIPQIAVGLSDMFGINVWQGAFYFVGSKGFAFKKSSLDFSLGYAFNIEKSNEISDFFFYKKYFIFSPLNGVFGGAELKYKNHSLLIDYDTQKVNAGYSYLISNQWVNRYLPSLRMRVGVYAIGLKSLSAQVSVYYRFGDRVLPI